MIIYLSKSCERIKKGVQALEKEEKYMIKNLYNEYCFNGIKKEKNYDKYELKKS